MNLDEKRSIILKDILELYQYSNNYDKLLQLIAQNESIAEFLKGDAIVYCLIMANNRLVWNGEEASIEFGDSLSRYQKCYQLYEQYVYYFLGANVIYPTMDYQVSDNLKELSLITNQGIDYRLFLTEDIPNLNGRIA